MNTQLHLGIDEARSIFTFPLTILAWLETTALKMEMATYIKRSRETDAWYLSRDDQAYGPVPFDKIIRMLLRGEGPIPILHQSDAELDPAPWHKISYRAWPVNTAVRVGWLVGFWLLAVAVGFVVVSLVCPVSVRTIAGTAYLAVVGVAGVWLCIQARRTPTSPQLDLEPTADGEQGIEANME